MQLDLYVPSGHKKPLPLVIFVHGGAWERGSHRNYRPAAIAFAKRGFATATVEYRLAGEAMFPAAIYDVKASIRWLRANSEKYHLDPERFGITGGSAGGNIAVLTAVTFGDARFEGPANHLDQSSKIQCVVSMYGPMGWTSWTWSNAKLESPLRNETLPDFHIANGAHLPLLLFLNEWDHREYRNWGPDTMDLLKTLGKADRAQLTLIDAPHGFINFLPHQVIAIILNDSLGSISKQESIPPNRERTKPNKTALSNPLPLRSRGRRVRRNLNLNRRGALSSGCQAFDVELNRFG